MVADRRNTDAQYRYGIIKYKTDDELEATNYLKMSVVNENNIKEKSKNTKNSRNTKNILSEYENSPTIENKSEVIVSLKEIFVKDYKNLSDEKKKQKGMLKIYLKV